MKQEQREEKEEVQNDEAENSSKIGKEAIRLSEATNDDGTVDVNVTDVHREDDVVVIEFQTPLDETKQEEMPWPDIEDDTYKIVRICEATVGSFSGLGEIENFNIRAHPDDWEIVVKNKSWYNKKWYLNTVIRFLLSMLKIPLYISLFASLSSIVGIFGLLFAYPFGVSVFSAAQGLSVLVASSVIAVVSCIIINEIDIKQS